MADIYEVTVRVREGSMRRATRSDSVDRSAVGQMADEPGSGLQRRLDEFVTRIAVRLMATSRDTLPEVTLWLLQTLAVCFEADAVALRRNDHEQGATILVDEWPRRERVPDPDPLGAIPFNADAVFGAFRDLCEPTVTRIDDSSEDYRERVTQGWGIGAPSMATAPLRYRDITEGALNLVSFHDRTWAPEELRALQTIAALLTQLQAWIHAEQQLQSSRRQQHLDELVTQVAVRLMSASRDSFSLVTEWTLRSVGEFFEVDTVFLRRNDHGRGVTILVDEWPRRENVPDPDPLGVVPFDADPVFASIRDLRKPYITRPEDSPDEYQERVEQGSGVPQVSMAMVPLVHDDTTEGVLGFVNFGDRPWPIEEINALRAIASLIMQLQARIDAEERLHHSAFHDSLTGLANRRGLLAELDRRSRGPDDHITALLFLDFDHFKTVNDALGHTAGDRLLVATGDRLRTAIRPGDLVARAMGDEFVVLLAAPVDRLEAFAVAERIRELVALPVETDGHAINRTVSIGVALGEVGRVTGEDLLIQADTALHSAKTRGRNQIVFFDDELRQAMNERYDTERLLGSAVEDSRLELHYQPELDLRTGRLLALEALMRWHHPTRGLLPAGAFIDVAEESGFIVELGCWVIEEAIRQTAIWVRQYPGLDLLMRVNLSPVQLMSPGLVGAVADCLTRHELPGRRVCFEITEHAVMQDVEAALSVLHDLAALGVEFAIDDFGIGHSSMAQLKRLPVATLKIDQSFVAGLPHDKGDRAIVDSIVHLGAAFEVELIAEGVETREQVAELLALGCHRAQGHLFHEALPVAGIEPLLDRERSSFPLHA